MGFKKILAAAVVLAAGSVGFAQDSSTTRGYLMNEPSTERWDGWAPFVGLNAGYTAYEKDIDVEGAPASAKLIGSFVTPGGNYVFDLGAGYSNQTFSQTDALDRNAGGAVAELAARYQWANRWQAGLVYDRMFNVGSNYGADQADVMFGGVQIMKEFAISQAWLMRLGARYQTDINVQDNWLNVAMIDVEFGYNPWGGRKTVSQSADTRTQNPTGYDDGPAVTGTASMPVPEKVEADEIWAKRDFLLFDNDSAVLDASDTARLERLVVALGEHPEIVGQVDVIGYADPNGTEEYNKDLSRNRAESVKKALTANGFEESKINVIAKGEASPLSTYAKSRRVELHFQDVKDREALARIVNAIE